MQTICCPKCNGTGRINLPHYLRGTYDVLKRMGSTTALELHTALGHQELTMSSTHNRLNKLKALGFVEKSGVGSRYNTYLWRVKQ